MSAKPRNLKPSKHPTKSTRHRKPLNVTLSDEARSILDQAEEYFGISRAAVIELCIRKHVAAEMKG
jgi:hypothetical protein